MRSILWFCLIAFVSMFLGARAVDAAPLRRLLVLDFEIVDTSNEPTDHRSEHAKRLHLVRDAIASELAARGLYEIADRKVIGGELDAILEHQFLRTCNGCELALARQARADLVMLGKFNKISTLIGSMDILIKDVTTGAVVYVQTFGFRGDSDQAWLRAAKFFVDGFADAQRTADLRKD
jgi:hypothetical protein